MTLLTDSLLVLVAHQLLPGGTDGTYLKLVYNFNEENVMDIYTNFQNIQ